MGAPKKSTQVANTTNTKLTVLPLEIQRSLEEVLDRIVEIEKEEYHNDLVPFSQREKQIREKGQKVIKELTTSLEKAHQVLKDFLELEEQKHPEIDSESHYARWEEASQKLVGMPTLLQTLISEAEEELALQDQCGLSWAFMDRAYATGKKLQEDKRLEDAANVFKFLNYLNSKVFEYSLNEADALFDLGRFNEAFDVYSRSLLLQPENPYVLYQIGGSCYQIGDIESANAAFDLCIVTAKNNEKYKDFIEKAQEAKRFLQTKKVA
jgi:tetratricopeptide (TPR) repeat protein